VAARRGVHARRVRRGREAPARSSRFTSQIGGPRPSSPPRCSPLRQRTGAVLPGPAHRLRPGQPVRGPVRRRR
jgi:hypothetical protein